MPRPGYVFPLALGSTHMAGSPRSINQSFGARCPQSPRQVRWLLMLVASPPMAGFSNSGRLATCIGVTRPNRVNLRYGSHLRLRRLRRSDYSDLTHTTLRRLHVERAIHMASSFHLAGLATAWRTGVTEPMRFGHREESRRSRRHPVPLWLPLRCGEAAPGLRGCPSFGRCALGHSSDAETPAG